MLTRIQRLSNRLRWRLGLKYHFFAAKRLLASRDREGVIEHVLAAGALAERLGYPESMMSAARMLMRLGIFERAWQLSGASLQQCRKRPLPEWDGGDLSGRTILIWPHEGHIGKD